MTKSFDDELVHKTVLELFNMVKSKQAEVDELRKRIDDALNVMCKLQYSSGERIYDEVGKILKGERS